MKNKNTVTTWVNTNSILEVNYEITRHQPAVEHSHPNVHNVLLLEQYQAMPIIRLQILEHKKATVTPAHLYQTKNRDKATTTSCMHGWKKIVTEYTVLKVVQTHVLSCLGDLR